MILTNQYIKQVVADYFKDKPVHQVYLFGSYARGDADENSDIDLMVDLDYSKNIGFSIFGWNEDLEALVLKKVDVIHNAKSPKEVSNWAFIKRIHNEMVSIYEK